MPRFSTWLRLGALCTSALLGAGTPALAADEAPMKIGLLIPTSGNFAAPGRYMKEGLDLYMAEHNNVLGGRKVVVVEADTAGNPQTGLTQLRRLVEEEHVDAIVGPLSNAVDLAIVPYLTSHKIPALYPVLSPDELTQRKPAEFVVRSSATSSQTTQPLGDYAYKVLKYRKVATIAYDFSFGWESIGGMMATFQGDGGKVVKQIWSPIVTSDYSPYLSQIPRDVDAVFCTFSGAAAVNFIKQYNAFGLKMPLVCQGNTVDESTLPATGAPAEGVVSALHYSPMLDTPANKKFVAAYSKMFNHEPSYYGEGTYVAAMMLDAAIGALKGDVSDKTKLVKALRSVRLDNAPRGPIKWGAHDNPLENVYIRKTNAKLENVVIKTYPSVSQFWSFKPDAFLQNPEYSRTFPACNACK